LSVRLLTEWLEVRVLSPQPNFKEYTMDYIQCRLERDKQFEVSWIPERFAVVDKYLKIQNEDGEWVDGWKVVNTYSRKTELEVVAARDFYRHHREATDI
jgi:hypothetical protein